jgi:hypothetical protein
MKEFSLEQFEIKYPKVSEQDGWLDLHLKRGTKEINDEEFKNELLKFGIESSDIDDYINFLIDFNNNVEDVLEDLNMDEMLEIIMTYENYSDREDSIISLLENGRLDEASTILQNELKMTDEHIQIVISSLQQRNKYK